MKIKKKKNLTESVIFRSLSRPRWFLPSGTLTEKGSIECAGLGSRSLWDLNFVRCHTRCEGKNVEDQIIMTSAH